MIKSLFQPVFSLLSLLVFLLIGSGCTEQEIGSQDHIVVLTGDSVAKEKVRGEPFKGDILVEASIGDADKLHSYLGADASSHDITELILLPLMEYDAQWNLIKKGAENFEITQRSTFRFRNLATVSPGEVVKKWQLNPGEYPQITGMGAEENNTLLWVHFNYSAPGIEKTIPNLINIDDLSPFATATFRVKGKIIDKIFQPLQDPHLILEKFHANPDQFPGISRVSLVLAPPTPRKTFEERFGDAFDWYSKTTTQRKGQLVDLKFVNDLEFYVAFKDNLEPEPQEEILKILIREGEAEEIPNPGNVSQVTQTVKFFRLKKQPYFEILFKTIPQDPEMEVTALFSVPEKDRETLKTDTFQGEMVRYEPAIEHNPHIKISLKEGVKFHDGVEWTTEDVLWNYRRLTDPTTETPYAGDYQEIKELTPLGTYTFNVVYKKPFAPALSSWGYHFSIPKHLCNYPLNYNDPIYVKNGQEIHYNRVPVGNGPFKFKNWETDEKIVIERNEQFYDSEKIPFIKEYVYRIIPDRATQLLELKAGSVDKMEMQPDQYLLHKESPVVKKTTKIFRMVQNVYTYLGYNHLDPKDLTRPNKFFGDPRVRIALAHAVDKKELIKIVVQGLGRSCNGPFSYASWAYNPSVKEFDYDLEKSSQLLDEAGWILNKNSGIREKIIDGKTVLFEFDILTNQGNSQREQTAVILAEAFKKVGVISHFKKLEWAIFLEKHVDVQNFDAIIIGWQLTPEPDCFPFFHSSQIGNKRFNFVGYRNREVDELILAGRTLYDEKKREPIYHRIHQILNDEQAYMFLYTPEEMIALSNRFTNIQPARMGLKYHYIDRWFVPKSSVKYSID